MKISKHSWHYKLYRYITNIPRGASYLNPFKGDRNDTTPPRSLCPYSWAIFLGLIGAFFILILAIIALPFYLVFLVCAFAVRLVMPAYRVVDGWFGKFAKLLKFEWRDPRHMSEDDYNLWRKKREARQERKQAKADKKRGRQSLIVAFVKAKKAKVCPTIELVD